MGLSERKFAVAVQLAMVLVVLVLAGCPQQAKNPSVTIQQKGGQAVAVSLTLAVGASTALQAQSSSPEDSIVWSTSAPDVAEVDASGLVTAIAPGTATILATGSVSLTSAGIEIVVLPASSDGEGEGEGEGEDQGTGGSEDEIDLQVLQGIWQGEGLAVFPVTGISATRDATVTISGNSFEEIVHTGTPDYGIRGTFTIDVSAVPKTFRMVITESLESNSYWVSLGAGRVVEGTCEFGTIAGNRLHFAVWDSDGTALWSVTKPGDPAEGEGEGEGEPTGDAATLQGSWAGQGIGPLLDNGGMQYGGAADIRVEGNRFECIVHTGTPDYGVRGTFLLDETTTPKTFHATVTEEFLNNTQWVPIARAQIWDAVYQLTPDASGTMRWNVWRKLDDWSAGNLPLWDAVKGAAPGEGESEGEAEGEGESEGRDVLVQMTPFSGRFGYGLDGPYGFVGALTKQELTDPAWCLEGDFSFPTAGYMVGVPIVTIQESYPEQVYVAINVTPPTGMVAQVITHVSISAEITASNDAQFAIHVITQANPNPGEGEGEGSWEPTGETSWIPGEQSPPAWTIQPLNPAESDVVTLSGPTQVYQNPCHALTSLGQGQLSIDRSSHHIRLTFFPVETFVACDGTPDPVCGLQGSFGPLEQGNWILYAENANDPLANFNIAFHVGPGEPGLDGHAKPVPDDTDGDFLTDAEEQALQRDPNNPDENQNGIPDGVDLARDLSMRVDALPECGVQPVAATDGQVVSQILPETGPCKTISMLRCEEKCTLCGEPYNCGSIEISNPALQQAGKAPFTLSLAALHYMQHGSFGAKWDGQAYAERTDIMGLLRALQPVPGPESVNLCEYLPLSIGNSWEYQPWNSLLTVIYPIQVTSHVVSQDMDLWTLSNNVSIGYVNGFLSAFPAQNAGAKDTPALQAPTPLLPEHVPIGVPIDTPFLGQVTVYRGPLTVLLQRFCSVTIDKFPLGEQPDTIAFVSPDAAGAAGSVFILGRDLGLVYGRYTGSSVPTATFLPQVGEFLLISAKVQGNESCPKAPPLTWIADGQCPAQWIINPPVPTPGTPIHFSGPTATFANACVAISTLGTPRLAIDPANQRIELVFDSQPGPVACPMIYAPVCGLEGILPPLKEGVWLFLCQHPDLVFQLSFTVQGPLPDKADSTRAHS